jgi:hypothetical protein
MRTLQLLLLLTAASAVAFCSPGGVLEKVKTIRVDPTVVEQPDKVKDPSAADLVRYNLRAAVMDAHFAEGDSPIRAHIVLDDFSSEGRAKRLMGLGTGHSISTMDGSLVIQDAGGKELAKVGIHVHGSIAFSAGDGNNKQSRQATSDLEQRLIEEIERLR